MFGDVAPHAWNGRTKSAKASLRHEVKAISSGRTSLFYPEGAPDGVERACWKVVLIASSFKVLPRTCAHSIETVKMWESREVGKNIFREVQGICFCTRADPGFVPPQNVRGCGNDQFYDEL